MKKVPGWLKVGGIGCGALVLIGVVLIMVGGFFFRDAIQEFESADRSMEDVAARFGRISDFRAEPSGAIPADRVEAFLSAREAVDSPRAELERALETLAANPARGGTIRKFGAGIGLLLRLADFLQKRNGALLEAEIGLGEYTYIYSLTFYSWLGKSPGDGPSFELVGEDGYVMQTAFEGADLLDVRERRAQRVRNSLNRLLLPVLRAQLADLADAEGDIEPRWKEELSEEIAALEADDHRIPWQDGLPEVTKSSLAPYRDRLEESYAPMCGALEIGVARR